MAEATLDSISGLVFQRLGVEGLRQLFSKPQFCFFRDEIIDLGDKLKAHGLTDAAEAMYALAPDFAEYNADNPYRSWTDPRFHYRESILRERGYGADWRTSQWAAEESARKEVARR